MIRVVETHETVNMSSDRGGGGPPLEILAIYII